MAQFAIVTFVMALGLFAFIFFILTGHDNVLGFLRLLEVSSEQSIPTFVSVINLLFASILIFVIYSYEKTNRQNGSGYWLFLSVLFLYLSVDESASVHENFGYLIDFLVNEKLIPPILKTHKWLPFGVLFVFVVSVILLPFLRQLAPDTRRYFLIAGFVFLTGAVGLEYFVAWLLETGIVESVMDAGYLIAQLFEEGFEMYGVAIFNCALYREILRRKITVIIGY